MTLGGSSVDRRPFKSILKIKTKKPLGGLLKIEDPCGVWENPLEIFYGWKTLKRLSIDKSPLRGSSIDYKKVFYGWKTHERSS